MILVDTCVLLDVVQADPHWADWSQQQLEHAAEHGGLLINPVIYAEFSVWYDTLQGANDALAAFGTRFEEVPRESLFLAGKAFRQYRTRRGTRTGVLPDFFIGAHAAARDLPLLTRDATRFRTYFPTVALLTPSAA
ncbi:MAG TPA: type II toxin-antitoxin system VapC family toxin [Rhodanobacteraceae bacterium]|nr:type II toxin-antitoxin system VapC family toxin [Rhodanobacteraceae bacterium]HET8555353.1 type II toxin-antitoxin system VapC family toxin [Rhodanobacteraceae bacterium]